MPFSIPKMGLMDLKILSRQDGDFDSLHRIHYKIQIISCKEPSKGIIAKKTHLSYSV